MASSKDFLSKYVKASAKKARPVVQKSNSWLGNALRSVGYSAFDVLEELMPATIDVAKVTATTGKDVAEGIRKARTTDRTLRTAMERNYYIGLGTKVLKNSLDDLKSGKFYNKERADQFFNDMGGDDDLDFGEDFDFGEDDFDSSISSSDGMSEASFRRRKGGESESTQIVVNTNLGPDSAIVQATNYQTETSISVGRAVIDSSKVNTRATMVMIGGLRNEINASLSAINENVSTIATSITDVVSKQATLSAKYYEDSISLQTQILAELQKQTAGTQLQPGGTNTRVFKEYNNVMDLFSSGGGIDPKGYMELVKKQFGQYVDSNMILSQIKFMGENKETLEMMAQNPLAFIPKAITKTLIPNTVRSIITEFDNQLKETGIAALNQISGLQRSNNPLLSAIGKIFGLQNKITISSVDKSAYNKGAVAWAGTDHQALTNVIPTLLRKIHASISGSEEIGFDYERGVFAKVRDIEKQAEKDKLYRETSGYSEYTSEFKEYLDNMTASSKEEKEAFYQQFQRFISALVRDPAGGRTFRKGGRDGKGDQDDIADLLGMHSDDPAVKLIRGYLSGMEKDNKAKLTAFFGSKIQEQRATIDRQNREIQADPVKSNAMYLDTGLQTYKDANKKNNYTGTDSHLQYRTARDVTGKSHITDYVTGSKLGGIGAGVVDKYGKNQTYYLREILQTLTAGIYVIPIGGMSGGTGGTADAALQTAIAERQTKVSDALKTHVKEAKEREKQQTHVSSYDNAKRQKDVDKGKIDTTGEFTQDQITLAGQMYQSEVNAPSPEKASFMDKIMGKIPEDSGLGRIFKRWKQVTDKSEKGLTTVFKKMDSALFEIVFGDPSGQHGFKAMFDKGLGVLKAGFFKFSTFLDNKILKPLDEALFGESGVFNKIKQSEFGQKVSEVFKTVMGKAETFLLGEKDGDGNRSGGLFSETANSLKDMGTNVKHAILGEKGPDGKPLPLDQDNSVMGNLKRMFKNTSESISTAIGLDPNRPKETLGTKVANGLDSAFNRIQERASDWSDSIFGQNPGGSEFLKQFKDDMKGQKGFIGASAVVGGVGGLVLGGHMGLLGSMFLPGGPIGGAILGAGIGIVSKSTGLKNFLFGPEETDAEGNVSRAGGVITKDFQKFFKDNKVGIGVGAGAGLAASIGLLPSFFVPGGPIGGALIGGALSLVTKSEAFQELLYGEGGSKDNATGGIMKKFKEIFGKDKDFKKVGIDAGIGAGVGLVGSFFLPGGPLLGALLGSAISVGTATDKFRDWFFGKAGEDGKREGGIFNKFTGYMKEKIFTPLGTAVKIAQNNILGFVKSEMVAPFKWALKPLIKEAQYAKTVVTDSIKGVFNSVKEQFQRHVTRPIGEAVEKHLINPMKQALNKLFSGFGKLIGNILAAPFKLITGLGKGAYARQGKRDQDARDTEIKNQYEQKRSEILGDESQMGFFRKIGNRIKNVGKLGKAASDRDRALRASNQQRKDEYQGHIDELEAEQARIRHETELKNAALRSGTKLDTDSEGRVAGIPLSVFSQRTGIGRNTLKNMIKRGQLPAVKHGSNWIISPDLVSRFKRGKISTPKPEAAPSTGGTDTTTTSQTTTTTQPQPGTPIPPTDTSAPAPTPTQETSGGKKRRRGRQSTVSTDAGSTRGAGTPPITGGSSSVNTSSGYKPESGESSVSPEGGSRKGKTYNMGSMTDRIQKDVSKIADSVWGQLNGVGSNINKIYKVLLKKLGLKDEDIQGENNKSYMGLFGRLRTAMNRPLRAIEDLITAPFRAVGRVMTNIKDGFLNIGKGIGKAGKILISGIGSIGKGLLGILGDIVKIPIDLLHTGLSAIRAALPAIGEAVKAGVSLIGTGLKTAGTLLYDGVKGIGSAISGAAKGFGQMVGGAMSGFGSLLKSLGLIGGDVLKGIWKGVKFVGAKGLQLAGTVASAPIKLFQSIRDRRREGGGGILGKKGPIHVIVDSGVLDKVKRVNIIEHIKDIEIGTPITAESQGTGILGAIQRRMAAFGQDDSGGQGGIGGKPLKPAKRMPLAGGRGFLGTATSLVLQGASKVGSGIKKVSETAGKVKTAVGDRFQKMKEIAEEDKFRDARKAEQVKKGSRAELLKRFDAEQEKKETRIYRGKVVSLLGQSAAAGEEHKDLFSGIFGKKGLITAGILLLMPIFIKLFKNLKLGELLKDLADTVVTGWSEIGGIKGLIANLGEKTDQVTDVINNTDTHAKVDENGNLVTDENGNPVMETTKNKGFFGRVKQLLTPTKTRVNTDTGKWEQRNEWTSTSAATAKLIGRKAIDVGKGALKFAKSPVGKLMGKGAKALGNKISHSTAVTAAYTYGNDALKAVGKGVKGFIQSGKDLNALKKAGSAFASEAGVGQKIASKVVAGGETAGKLIETFAKKALDALNFLVGKLAGIGEKFGLKIPVSSFDDILKPITTKVLGNKSVLSSWGKKISEFLIKLTGKESAAAATLFIAEAGFIIYGAIDGAVNAGGLFEVNPDAVDAKMRAIAAVFKGLLGTGVGSIVDFVNSMVYEILGMNFIKVIASWTYKLLSNEEDAQALEAAQQDFTKGYEDYVAQEYEAYKKGQEAKGEAAMSMEDFKASSLSTTRSEYNSKTNKSLFRRAIDGVKNIKKLPGAIADGAKKLGSHVVGAAKGVKNFFVGSKEDILKKEDGSYYVATKNGYNYYGADGKLIYEDVSADSVNAMLQRGELTQDTKETKSGISKIGSKIAGGVKSIGNKIANSKIGKGVTAIAKGVKNKVKSGINFVKSAVSKDIALVKAGAKAAVKKAGRFLFGSKEEVYYTTQGSYYVKNGEAYDYYSSTGNKIGEGFDANDIEPKIESGELTPGTKEQDGVLTPAINAIKTAKTAVVNAWNTGVSFIKQKATAFGQSVANVTKKIGSAIANSSVGKGFKKFFIGTNETRYYDTNGGYYKKNGETYDYYSASDSLMSSGVPAEDFEQMLSSGELVAQEIKEQSTVSKIGDGIKSIGKSISNWWTKSVDSAKTAVKTFGTNVSNFVSKIGSAVANSSIGKGFKKFFIGGTTTGYFDSQGGYYVRNGDSYDYYDPKGTKISAGIPGDEVDTLITSGQLTAQEIEEDSTISKIGSKIKSIGSTLKNGIVNAVQEKIEWAKEVGSKAMSLASSALTSIKENGLFGSIKNFFSKKKGKGLFDMKGNYYVEQSDGTYKYFNGNGDEIASGIPAEDVEEKLQDGLLVEGEVETGDSDAKVAINKMKSAISDSWKKAKDVVSSAWSSFTSWLGGKGGDDITKSITSETTVSTSNTSSNESGGRGGEAGGRPLAGGRGLPQETEIVNGMPYFSQNDPRYKNMPYKQTGGYGSPVSDTIGDSGCGPTAMAMVASRFSGEGYTPPVMSKMAEAGGYSTSVGTSPEYFSAAGNALGIPNQQVAPTRESLENSLANGDSVVLQGISGGRGGEAGVNSPYTNEGHYVTATGISGDRVLINDPRGPEYSGEYRTKDVIHDTTGMWSFGPGSVGGFGERVRNKYKGLKKALPGGKGGMSWLEVVQDVKKQIANYGRGYVYGGNVEKITSNGFTISHRTDCSGFVSICLSCYAGKTISVTSNTLLNAQPAISAAGFTKMSWPGWDNLKQGDIMSRSGHTEIFCKNENGQHYVWNCGSNSSCNNPGPTGTGHSQGYTVIWRCNNPGVASDVAINQAANTSGGDYSGGSYDSGGSTASASSGGFSSFTELLGGLANAAATPFLKAFGLKTDDSSSGGGSYSGGDYSGGYDSGGVSSSTGTGSAVSNLTGNSDTEKIWNHLTKTTGLDKFAAAGFMGCWEEESHNSPHTVEGNYLSGYKNMGGESTVLANNANLNKYTTSVLFPAYQKSGISINQSAYKGSDGNYYPGFGLAQWTGPRGQALFDWSKQQGVDWRELGTQLGYVDYELKNNKRGTPATYNGTSSVEDGLWKAMKIYEGNQSQKYYNKRLPHARKYYQLYAGGSGGEGGGRPLRSVTPIRQRKALPLPGGRGGNADILSVNSSLREAVTQSKDPTTRIVERNIINNGAESHDMAQLLKAGLEYLAQIVTNTGNMDKGITDLNDKEVKLINQTNNTTNNVNNSRNSYGSGQNDEAVGDRSKYAMAKRVARGTVEV